MALTTTMEFPRADVDAIFRQVERASKSLGQDIWRSLAWAGVYIARSMAAATKIAPKLRPIVQNPDKRYKTDARRAPFGVMRWKDGKQYFKSIYRTGEYGAIRFFDKRSSSWFSRYSGDGKWVKVPVEDALGNKALYSIKTDKRRNIERRGLAKRAWTWAAANMYSGGTGSEMGVPNIASVKLTKSQDNASIVINDNLRYAGAAAKQGAQEAALRNAARKLEHNITQNIQRKVVAV